MYIVLIYERNSINKFEQLDLVPISIRFPLWNVYFYADLIYDTSFTIIENVSLTKRGWQAFSF